MKILWLNWRDIKNPARGGAEIMTHETAKRLVKNGSQVTLLTAAFPGAKDSEIIDGVKIIRRGNRFTCRIWAFIQYQKKFKGNIDLVIDEINTIPFFTNFYVKKNKIALIHQMAKQYWWTETFFPLNLIGYWLESLYLKLYTNMLTIAASQSTKKDLQKLGFKKVFIFQQGLSLKPLKMVPQKPGNPELIFIGRLIKSKGPQDALLAFDKIRQKFKTARLTICTRGSESSLKQLRNQIKNLNLKKLVNVFGDITLEKKSALLKNSHLVLVPSQREGWNLVPIEANAHGTPAVGYKVPGLVDSIKNQKTGILTKPNPDSLAQAVIILLSNKNLLQKYAENALAWSNNFNWDKTYESFVDILNSGHFNASHK